MKKLKSSHALWIGMGAGLVVGIVGTFVYQHMTASKGLTASKYSHFRK